MKKEKIFVLALLTAIGIFAGLSLMPANPESELSEEQPIEISGTGLFLPSSEGLGIELPIKENVLPLEDNVNVYIKRAGEDDFKLWDSSHNTITNIGKNYVRQQIGSTMNVALNSSTRWLSVSNSSETPDATWTQLVTEQLCCGLARANTTYSDNGTGAWNYTITFTLTGTVGGIRMSGLHWVADSNSNNNLASVVTFTSANFSADDQLRVIHSIST